MNVIAFVFAAISATAERIFHFMRTPDCDAAREGHVHLEIKPGAHAFIVN